MKIVLKKYIMKHLCKRVLLWFIVINMVQTNTASISENEYSLMPELFFMDNYDKCLLQSTGVFCTFTYKILPFNSSGRIWQIIKNVSENPQNYEHDKLRHGICVSNTCKSYGNGSLEKTLQDCYDQKYFELGFAGNISELNCETNIPKYSIDKYDIIVSVTLLGYLIFVVAASAFEGLARYGDKELYSQKCERGVGRFVSAFSIPKNWHRLRYVKVNSDIRKLRGIQGMRFYNMICVILTHTLMTFFAGPVANPKYLEQTTQKVLNMFLANGWYAVQTFFVISGWLLSFNFFKMMEHSSKLTIIHLCLAVVNRLLRLIPPLVVMIAIHSTILVHVGRGPNWDVFIGEEYENCRANWWTNLLFINNYVHKNNMCLQQTWYIAADMQLFVFYLLLLRIIWAFPKQTKVILGLTLFIGLLIPGILAFVNQYDIIVRQYPEILYKLNLLKLDHWHDLYSSGYSNIFGYGIGVTFGYIFYQIRQEKVPVNKFHVVLWWILTFGMCISVILIAAIFYDPDFPFSPLGSAVYWSLGKNLFALGIAIGIFGFTQKIGWFARWFCEWSPIQILGRLTYSTYIVHVAIARIEVGFRRSPVTLNDNIMFIAILGDVSLAYLMGCLMCLLVEMPISALQKILFPPTTRTEKIQNSPVSKSLELLNVISDALSPKEGQTKL